MIAHGVFLECLEPYILSDKLVSIPPTVMKDFVEHYQEKQLLESVEACIVHLEVTSLDIHQVGVHYQFSLRVLPRIFFKEHIFMRRVPHTCSSDIPHTALKV